MAGFISAQAIRAGVCAVLDSDPDVAVVLQKRVAFRDVGAFTTFPFLAIGHTTEPMPPQSRLEEHLVTVHLWLRPGEMASARDLVRIVRGALDRGRLRLRGVDVLKFSHEASRISLAAELEALHATVRYRLRLSRPRGAERTERPQGSQVNGTNAA